MGTRGFLFDDERDRERLLEMDRLIAPRRKAVFMMLGAALLISGPWVGWWTLIPLLVAAVIFHVADNRSMENAKRPELLMLSAWCAAQVIIAISVALSGAALSASMSWLAIPLVTLSARFPLRGVIAGTAFTLALLVAVAFTFSPGAVIADPTLVIFPAATILCVGVLSTALLQSDLRYRSRAVIDQLTGMLNRNGLESRQIELAQQSRVAGLPVGVIVGDLDRFKLINDSKGHVVGDNVLRDVAYVMRKELRAFELAYRLGGEEFLILVPGADLAQARELAERLRTRVSSEPVGGGLRVTMSFGVSASQTGREFDFDRVFAEADAALYQAKADGRDRVCHGVGIEAEPGARPAVARAPESPIVAGARS